MLGDLLFRKPLGKQRLNDAQRNDIGLAVARIFADCLLAEKRCKLTAPLTEDIGLGA